jgi:hypothetical protein
VVVRGWIGGYLRGILKIKADEQGAEQHPAHPVGGEKEPANSPVLLSLNTLACSDLLN